LLVPYCLCKNAPEFTILDIELLKFRVVMTSGAGGTPGMALRGATSQITVLRPKLVPPRLFLAGNGLETALFRKLKLCQTKLARVPLETDHSNFIIATKEFGQLKVLVNIECML
jgi:hypothetical protein